jgi:hypothetical protein
VSLLSVFCFSFGGALLDLIGRFLEGCGSSSSESSLSMSPFLGLGFAFKEGLAKLREPFLDVSSEPRIVVPTEALGDWVAASKRH